MELVFSKEDNKWVVEFDAASNFNLHIEGVSEGNVAVFQRTVASGEYAYVVGSTPASHGKVYDYDFAGMVYPKFIKVECLTEPSSAEVTFG